MLSERDYPLFTDVKALLNGKYFMIESSKYLLVYLCQMKVRAKKHLGQHFLKDKSIAEQIVNALSWKGYNKAIEVGPGMGVLTDFLIEQKRNITAIEIDSESVDYLNAHYNSIEQKLPIIQGDFLQQDFSTLLNEQTAVIGNFPYNISSQIMFHVIEHRKSIPEVVGMFQKEVAERFAAKEGNKTYGILSVLIQAYYHVNYEFTVHENAFNPPPRVKSGVVKFTRYRTELPVPHKLLRQVVKVAFGQRRKTLRNALKSMRINPDFLKDEVFNLRAEQLSVSDFIELTQKIQNERSKEV